MVHQKFAATRFERGEIGIRDFDIAAFFQRERRIALEVECAPVPIGIFVRDVPENSQIDRAWIGCTCKSGYRPIGFTARDKTGIDQFAIAFGHRRIRELYRFNLRSR